MIIKKPSIFIYIHKPDSLVLKEVCAGIEEEGVFYEIADFPTKMYGRTCLQSCRRFHARLWYRYIWHRCLPQNEGFGTSAQYRKLSNSHTDTMSQHWSNSARAIKKLPFKDNHSRNFKEEYEI